MSDTNRVSVRIIEEVTFGVTPVTPAFQDLRITGAPSLAKTPQTEVSNEIRSDRNIADLALVGIEAGGQVDHELSFRSLDTIIEGAMFDVWIDKALREGTGEVTDITVTTDVNVVAGETFQENDIVEMLGWPTAANNGVFVALTGTTGTVIKLTGLTNETAVAGTSVRTVGFQGASGDIDSAITPNRLTSTALDFTTLDLVVGEWIKIGGTAASDKFVLAALNDWCRISIIAATALTFDIVPVGWAAETGTGLTINLFLGSRLRNGVTKHSYSVEEEFGDHTPVTFQYFVGMIVSNFVLNLAAKSIVTATVNFLGSDASIQDSGRFAGATTIVAPSTDVLNTSSNVGRISENGVEITGPNFVLDSSITLENNLRLQDAIGSLGAIGVGVGEFSVTGNLTTYFGDKTLVEKVINNTETSYDIRFKDAADNILLLDLPRVKYTEGSPSVPGKNDDVTANLAFQAILEPTLGYTMHIGRYYYTEV